ncbi:MAG: hypothetical protein U0R51_07265 [Solirubrobacterales bacterium]
MPPAYRARSARIAAAALAVLLASVLAACGSTDSTTTVTESSAPADGDAAATVAGTDAAGAIPPTTTTATSTATTTTPGATTDTTALPETTTTIPATPLPATSGSASTDAVLARPFLSDSPWNTRVSGRPVDPDSRRMMRKAQLRVATTETPNGKIKQQKRRIKVGLTVNVTQWTVPVFSNNQPGAIPRIAVCRQLDCGPDAVDSITIPADACPDPRYDGWMTALDVSARIAYDFWRGRCEADGSLSYHYVKAWPLDGPGFQQPTGVSARGSGLPLFAGLITPEEVRSGRIDHALAISVPGAAQRRYVQPASRTDGTGDLGSVPEGARLRLRRGAEKLLTKTFVRNGTERATARTIITALERYGAIVVDRSAAPTMYAQRNADWRGILPLNLLQDIPLKRFDVVDLGRTYLDPPKAGEEPALPPGTPGSVPSTTGGTASSTAYAAPSTDFGQVIP